MENRKSKRSVRLALVLGAALAGTALVGWGGLAAWQAYTQNGGNTFAVGTLSHTNSANLEAACPSNFTSGSPAACSLIVGGPVAGQLTSDFTGTSGTVTIASTGTLGSTFSMSMATPGSSELCTDLTLAVSDSHGYDYGTASAGVALTAPMGPTALNNSAGSPSWAQNDSNEFTFWIGTTNNFANDYLVLGTSCSFTIVFTQASA
jgi:hypothetical protein